MEKTNLLTSRIWYLVSSVLLAAPLIGILSYSKGEIASSELTDTVILHKVFPDFMQLFAQALTAAMVLAFIPPLRPLYTLALGCSLGGLYFHYLDIRSSLMAMNDLGVSTRPVEELVTLLPDGQKLLFYIGFALLTLFAISIITAIDYLKKLLRDSS